MNTNQLKIEKYSVVDAENNGVRAREGISEDVVVSGFLLTVTAPENIFRVLKDEQK